VVVIFGASGDLACYALIPSLYALGGQGLLPEPFAIIGFARRAWDDEAFRDHVREIVRRQRPFREALWQKFARGLRYVQGDFTSPASEAYATLRETITKLQAERYLPDNIYTAIDHFEKADWTTKLLGADVKGRYADLKRASADRCPRALGTFVKAPEVQYHHEVYNQFLWNLF